MKRRVMYSSDEVFDILKFESAREKTCRGSEMVYLFVLHELELDVRSIIKLGEQLGEVEGLLGVDEDDIDEAIVELGVRS